MRRLILSVFLLAPLAAFANDHCSMEKPIDMKLDLAGIQSVQFEVNAYSLHIDGQDADAGHLTGRACASDKSVLDGLTVTQRREGDRLVVELSGHSKGYFTLGHYESDIDVSAKLPPKLAVVVNVGSGDGWINGVAQAEARVGSGDLHLAEIQHFRGSIGSGDIDGHGMGNVELSTVGSGDVKLHDIRQDVRLGSIGSGDASFTRVGGSVRVDTLGSGDLTVREVKGDFSLGAKGSGDVHKSDISGKVSMPHGDDDDE